MNCHRPTRRKAAWIWAAALAIALGLAPHVSAQQLTGNIFGRVVDEQGGKLPGVTVTLSGIGAARTQTTDARGEFRFPNLAPGVYTLTYELQSFTKVTNSDVKVSVGQNTETNATLKISSVEATVVVEGAPALLDTRQVQTGAVVDQTELTQIPTARDPWVVLSTVPGVQVDRVNVGGNESGQQSTYVGKGADSSQNTWNVDGVTITDMGALGSSPNYYDFDSFQEMQASTGGSDVTAASPGVQLNLVTKRGTNDVHGSARYFLANSDLQWNNVTPEDQAQGVVNGGNRINEVQDYGIELGGPLWRDKIWAWGAYGRNQINLFNAQGNPDNTTLIDYNAKINWQLFDSTSLAGTFSNGNKEKFGRNVSFSRPPPASWNQTGPTTIWRGEISQIFSSSLFFTASYSSVSAGFSLTPQGGTDVNDLYINEQGQFIGSYLYADTVRPQKQATASGSYFFNTGAVGNELKYGFNYRTTDVDSVSSWPGNGNYGDLADFNSPVAVMTRDAVLNTRLRYYSGYLSDTLTFGNLTINAGVRYDNQQGHNLASTTPANPVIPDLLPGITTTDQPAPFTWENVVPRIGATYALGQDKKTLLRASYSQYADQLGANAVAFTNAGALAGLYYYWNDINGDHVITRNELNLNTLVSHYGVDPANPGSSTSPNVIDPNFKAGKTSEVIAGIERELLDGLVVGVSYTYRKYDGALWPHRTGLTENDYEVGGYLTGRLFNGAAFDVPYYQLKPGVDVPAGLTLSNRPDWNTTYNGVDLTFQKRLSDKWLIRGGATYQTWNQHGGAGSCYDPTSDRGGNNELWPGTPIGIQTGSTCAGDDIAALPAGSASGARNEVFLNARWLFNVSGLYQLPAGFAVAANFFGREGYPYINYYRYDPGDGLGPRDNILTQLSTYRYGNVYELDLRLEKVITVKPLEITIAADVFNAANSGTVLQRNARVDLGPGVYNQIIEMQSPRVVRFGARLSF
ncbi:MAG TPA: TonB-dependent receptor [Thermoanaerobaculia bacterium]|nr:TonB-dependent receptor [Thermoanaerobaculia bacterium]